MLGIKVFSIITFMTIAVQGFIQVILNVTQVSIARTAPKILVILLTVAALYAQFKHNRLRKNSNNSKRTPNKSTQTGSDEPQSIPQQEATTAPQDFSEKEGW